MTARRPNGENGGQQRVPGHPGLISVRTEVAKEFLIDKIFEEVARRHPGELSSGAEVALGAAVEHVIGAEGARAATRDAVEMGTSVSRAGYLTRVVEGEMFERARAPTPELTDALRERLDAGKQRLEAVAAVSGELARREPVEKPPPDHEDATSWRVPGPGGHVRHYLALRAVRSELGRPAARADRPRASAQVPDGSVHPGDLKRCWMYGFYVRCCEDSLGP